MDASNPIRRGTRWNDRSLHLSGLGADAVARPATRLDLAGGERSHDEGWLQDLLHRFPELLPIHDLEPGFGRPVALCREMATRSGFVDNVLVTPQGDIVLVECKLWRNPQARREVVAQIVDYAHSLSGWSYSDLEAAALKARPDDVPGTLHAIVADEEGLDEPAFVDAVSRNLRLGRFLLLIVGDGIREEAETLAEHLQQHAGFHFTLGLVEMPVFELPDGGYLLQPRVLARTVNIERGIVRIEDGGPVVKPLPASSSVSSAGRRTSISEERLFEALGEIDPTLPERLRGFVDGLADEGLSLEPASKSLILRWTSPASGVRFNMGAIDVNGRLGTAYANWDADSIGRLDVAHRYQEELATLVNGEVRRTPNPAQWYVVKQGTQPPAISEMLDGAAAIRRFAEAINRGREAT